MLCVCRPQKNSRANEYYTFDCPQYCLLDGESDGGYWGRQAGRDNGRLVEGRDGSRHRGCHGTCSKHMGRNGQRVSVTKGEGHLAFSKKSGNSISETPWPVVILNLNGQ